MDIEKYIIEQALILIPVLYVLGMILKGINVVDDKYIPLILLPISIILSMFLVGFNVDGVIQGILICGVTVYTNQLIKQLKE